MLVDVSAGQGQHGGPDLEIEAGVGAGAQVLHAHRLRLAVDRLDGRAEGAQTSALGRHVRDHVVLADRLEVDTGVVPDARLVGGTVVGLVGVDPGVGRQAIEEFVDGGEVVVARREQGVGDGDAVGGADQVQAPAEDLLFLGRAVAQ